MWKAINSTDRFSLTSMASLASTYRSQERWKEAEKLQVVVMKAEKLVLGAVYVRAATLDRFYQVTLQDEGSRAESSATDAFPRYPVNSVSRIHPLQPRMVIGHHHLIS
jgi:hypothetical protein